MTHPIPAPLSRAPLALALIIAVALFAAPALASAQSPAPAVELRAYPARVAPGDPVRLAFTVAHSNAAAENLIADLSIAIPNGWSVSSTGNAQSCAANCRATYNMAPGQSRSVELEAIPLQAGTFAVEAVVSWRMGDESGELAARPAEVEVAEPDPAPTAQPESAGGQVPSPPKSPPAPESPTATAPAPEPPVTTEAVTNWMRENTREIIIGLIGGSVILVIVVNVISNFITELLKGIGALALRMFRRKRRRPQPPD